MRPGNKLFWLTQAATLYVLWLFALELRGGAPVEANPVTVYLALLGAYAADKELGRWAARKRPAQAHAPRKGSWIVVLWVLFYFTTHGAHLADPALHVPEGLARVVLWVVGIFFGTGSSKRLFSLLQDEGAPWAASELGLKAEAARVKGEREAELESIAALLKANPQGLSVSEVAKGSGVPLRSSFRYLRDLVSTGKVRVRGAHKSTRYFLRT